MSKILKTVLLFILPIFCFDMVKSNKMRNQKKKIMNDTVMPGQFPFLVKLITKDGRFVCSGSVVSEIKVLTAAHCVLQNEAEIVVAGSVDTKADNPNEQRRNIMKYVVHPKYSRYVRTFKKKNRSNDLGMVTLQTRFTPTLAVQAIPIAAVDIISDARKRYVKRFLYEWFYEYDRGWRKRRPGSVIVVGNNNFKVTRRRRTRSRSGEADKAECVNDGKAHFSFFEVKFNTTRLNEEDPVYVSRPFNPDKVICGSDAGGPLINLDYPFVLHGVHCSNTGNESYDVSTTVPDNHKWILSQLYDNSFESRRKNGQKACKFEQFWTLSVFGIIQIHGYIQC